ncbi:MAG TPA: GNAT family N-acetyltransferase [Anaerolineae bacterium]
MAASPLWIRYGVTFASAGARFAAGLEAAATILVADAGDEIAGFVWCEPRGAFARSGYIPLIGVQPDQTSQGVGARLLAAAEAHFRSVSSDVFLLVSDFNAGAQRFYERQGYHQVGALPDYVLPGITELIYRKRLPPT